MNEFPIVGRDSQEAANISHVFWCWPISDGTQFGRIALDSMFRHYMSKVGHFILEQRALRWLQFQVGIRNLENTVAK